MHVPLKKLWLDNLEAQRRIHPNLLPALGARNNILGLVIMAKDDYEYDFFLSYSRRSPVREWVQNHFYPVILECLDSELDEKPEIFVDWLQEGGVDWPNNLERALKRSRFLLPVFSPQYFRSAWCMTEWRTFREREKLSNLSSVENPHGLVLPVKFSDGDHYHDEAKRTQFCCDLSAWRIPEPVFRESTEWIPFRQKLNWLAEQLARRIAKAPPWEADWPVIRSPPLGQPRAKVPRH